MVRSKAEKEEREKAEAAYGAIEWTAVELKNRFSVMADKARPEEERYRSRIAIEVRVCRRRQRRPR